LVRVAVGQGGDQVPGRLACRGQDAHQEVALRLLQAVDKEVATLGTDPGKPRGQGVDLVVEGQCRSPGTWRGEQIPKAVGFYGGDVTAASVTRQDQPIINSEADVAMRPCRECGNPASTEAATCPSCGVKSPTKAPPGWRSKVVLAIGSLVFFTWCFNAVASRPGAAVTGAATEADLHAYVVAQAKSSMKSQLKDPASAIFGETSLHKVEQAGKSALVACGTYKSKNSFGGYTSSKQFVSTGTPDFTFSSEAGDFEGARRTMCVGAPVFVAPAEAP
jgi:hypothetical protein